MKLYLLWSWSQMEYHFGIKCDFLQRFSVNSLSIWYLVLIPSFLICNKFSNEWSAFLMGQLVLSELKKIFQKSWRTWVRTDISSTFRRFELMSVQSYVLTPNLKPASSVRNSYEIAYGAWTLECQYYAISRTLLTSQNQPLVFEIVLK